MKPLKPSHRENKRYLLISGREATKNNIEQNIIDFIGILGFAKSCPQVIKETKKGIILCINREYLDEIRTSFFISGKDIRITKVSGSVGKLK